MNSIFRTIFALVISLALAFGVFAGSGLAASSQPAAADGINPVASGPTGIGYCYPSGYNRQGWRCGWRLAMAPYNLGDAAHYGGYWYNGVWYPYYNYNYNYNPNYYNPYGYNYYPYDSGRVPPPSNGVVDYGGKPRYGYYWNYNYNYNYGCYCR